MRKKFDGVFKSIEKIEFDVTTMEKLASLMTSKTRGSLCLSLFVAELTKFVFATKAQKHEVSQRRNMIGKYLILKSTT